MRRTSVERSIGCAAVVPAGLIGFAGLADGIGPTGWRGFSELFGWAAVCVAAGLLMAKLLAQTRRPGLGRYAAILAAILAASSFAYLLNWLGLDAPMWTKRAFTSSMQVVGLLAPIAAAFCTARFLRRKRRHE